MLVTPIRLNATETQETEYVCRVEKNELTVNICVVSQMSLPVWINMIYIHTETKRHFVNQNLNYFVLSCLLGYKNEHCRIRSI